MAILAQNGVANGQIQVLDAIEAWATAHANWSVVNRRDSPNVPGLVDDSDLVIRRTGGKDFMFSTQIGATRPRFPFKVVDPVDLLNNIFTQPSAYNPQEAMSIQDTDNDKGGSGLPVMNHNWWLIGDDEYLHGIVEVDAGTGVYQNFSIGQIATFNGVNNGEYSVGNVSVAGYTDNDFDYDSGLVSGGFAHVSIYGLKGESGNDFGHVLSHAGNWEQIYAGGAQNNARSAFSFARGTSGSGNNFADNIIPHSHYNTSDSNIVPAMIPSILYVPHSTIAGKHAPMGEMRRAFYINTEQIGEAQLLTVGPESYRVFPAVRSKRVQHPEQFSGVAIREV